MVSLRRILSATRHCRRCPVTKQPQKDIRPYRLRSLKCAGTSSAGFHLHDRLGRGADSAIDDVFNWKVRTLTTMTLLNVAAILFAFLAAGLWFASACVNLPKQINMGWGGVGGTAQDLVDAVRRAAIRSGFAAACAGAAATCQGASLLMAVFCQVPR